MTCAQDVPFSKLDSLGGAVVWERLNNNKACSRITVGVCSQPGQAGRQSLRGRPIPETLLIPSNTYYDLPAVTTCYQRGPLPR